MIHAASPALRSNWWMSVGMPENSDDTLNVSRNWARQKSASSEYLVAVESAGVDDDGSDLLGSSSTSVSAGVRGIVC